jgi:predicted AAA+ superfamily ATPase
LLGIDTARALARSSFLGAIFEGFVASEIAKQQLNLGRRRELYFFRDERGLEVDFIVPSGPQKLMLIEAKASQTVYPDAARGLLSLARSIANRQTKCVVVHDTAGHYEADTALAPGARAMGLAELLQALRESRKR